VGRRVPVPSCLSPLPLTPSLSSRLLRCRWAFVVQDICFFPNVSRVLTLSADSERDSSAAPLRPASYSRYHPYPMVTGFR